MATSPEKLAGSLELLHKFQTADGAAAIRARDLPRTHRERPVSSGFLQEVMKRVNDAYVTDAYHSLSIEAYRVSRKLIERVRSGTWNPESNENGREQRNAMAARGYWQADQAVQESGLLSRRFGTPARDKAATTRKDAGHGFGCNHHAALVVRVGQSPAAGIRSPGL